MRKRTIGGAIGLLLSVVLVACGGSNTDSTDAEARRFQDMWEIDKIEKDFHQATSEKDIDLMAEPVRAQRNLHRRGRRDRGGRG